MFEIDLEQHWLHDYTDYTAYNCLSTDYADHIYYTNSINYICFIDYNDYTVYFRCCNTGYTNFTPDIHNTDTVYAACPTSPLTTLNYKD